MMTVVATLILLFSVSLGLSLVLTPLIRSLGIKLGAIDIPMERNVHTKPIPRIGGLAVLLSYAISLVFVIILCPQLSQYYFFNLNVAMGYLGSLVVFSCGLWDDFRRLNPWTKLFFQVVAATLPFMGSAKISGMVIGSYGIHFNFIFSYVITVFWFLLFINAVNLIDGLDGLAGGLVFFTCLVMIFSLYIHGDYLSALYFTILGGAVLGFLRYNFNPATVFLGDGGSYFLGYVVAYLAILSSSKSHVGSLMLIPLLALGVPIFDAILSPIRRFIRGRSIFQADKGHIHHVFLRMGLSSRNAVLLLYGITMGLCIMAIFMTMYRGKGFEGFFLALLLFGMIFLVRKLGYLEYLAFEKFSGWFKDVTDVTGISQTRRSFLSQQIAINNSQNMDELWENVVEALEMLKFTQAQLCVGTDPVRQWISKENRFPLPSKSTDAGNKDVCVVDSLMRIEIPLQDEDNMNVLGKMILIKDLKKGNLETYTIRRMETLRRTLNTNIKRFIK